MPKTAAILGLGKQQVLVQVAVHPQTPVGAMLHIETRVAGRLMAVFDGEQTVDGVIASTSFRPDLGEATVEVTPLVNGSDRSNRTSVTVAVV